ncbi:MULTISPECIES: hypothetical protein [unclassified Anabaena]|jgi:hypothetical protein|uniref:hypothetical protein n=1 Tax=unclassified Anabaena TaxID=2619674 RepID=UPI0004B4E374|nr:MULTISPECIES: hypothetical protein [unclassified Anabaena]MCX5983676.1 hypothetical protein [Nostocales cyanobacterium LacPavin_0920_SED1_MAG_38_18]
MSWLVRLFFLKILLRIRHQIRLSVIVRDKIGNFSKFSAITAIIKDFEKALDRL